MKSLMITGLILFFCWTAGQVFRENFLLTTIFFYIPSPAIFIFLFTGSSILFKKYKPGSLLLLLLSLIPLFFVIKIENRWFSQNIVKPENKPVRLVHWNVAYCKSGNKPIFKKLEEYNADIYILSETLLHLKRTGYNYLNKTRYHVLQTNYMSVLSKNKITLEKKVFDLPRMAHIISTIFDNKNIRILFLDFPREIFKKKNEYLDSLNNTITSFKPDIIVGDLNIPRRFYKLLRLPGGYGHAYNSAGSGWSYTWPSVLPLWAIDHCIINKTVQPVKYDLETSFASDHRIQVFDFLINK